MKKVDMNTEQVNIFLKLQPQIKSAYEELSVLSKKKPTESLNKFKLKFINSILKRANDILGVDYMPFPEEFTLFDEDDMPNNGDVVFILSHYLTSLEKLRCDNIEKEVTYPHHWYWIIGGKQSTQETEPPSIK